MLVKSFIKHNIGNEYFIIATKNSNHKKWMYDKHFSVADPGFFTREQTP